jgi:hypothetical protein
MVAVCLKFQFEIPGLLRRSWLAETLELLVDLLGRFDAIGGVRLGRVGRSG